MTSQSQELEEVKCLTAKQIKKLAKPEFAKNPEKFYPVNTLKKWGFHRAQCPKCGEHFWRHTEKKMVCGDSKCESRYHFIGKKTGIGKTQHVSYSDAWNGFKRSFETAKIPHTAIARYPVVARWRDDVDFVAAGIFCFQPYCVTGELDPPANPLICPQFCLRFNDLDNIGLSGRHYSGFVMLGIQVFNKPEQFVYFKEECVDFNLRWLTEELKIDPDEITLIEDVWAGGGNLGPSVEYFIGGLEIGNMVFMQYKTFPDGSREELKVQVIDVGIGLERVPWLLNGENTSYITVFKNSLEFLQKKLNISVTNEGWEKFGPYSCLLNMDEVDDIDKTWNSIAQQCGMTKEALVNMIKPVQEIFVIADHTRTAMMAIEDGCLPAHSGGASNVRNILRRVFAILERNDWWSKIGGLPGLLELFEHHRTDLGQLYGPFKPYSSFPNIIAIEYERWQSTEAEAKQKLLDLVKKRPNGQLTIDDWISSIQGLGIDADRISLLTNQPVPGNLYLTLAEKQETTMRVQPKQPYDTIGLPPTEELFYKSESQLFDFDSKIVKVIKNVETNRNDIVVLQETCFYPLAGGQDHDVGKLNIKGKTYEVVNVQKVGKCVLHFLSESLPEDAHKYEGESATGQVDKERRLQLRNHHTGTHIIFAAARRVLGPHVWQHGAKKTTKYAHIDITHYKSLTFADELAIENEGLIRLLKNSPTANRIVQSCTDIHKYGMPKEDAEKKYGFALYQGGVVAGSVLRVVEILGVDHEACCGTHADNTAQVGAIKILNANRISDGIVRIKFVAGEKALEEHNHSAKIMHDLCSMWNVLPDDLVGTASRFFQAYKQNGAKLKKQSIQIIEFQVKLFLREPEPALLIQSDEPTATVFISTLPVFAEELKKSGKSVVAFGSHWVYGVLGKEGLNLKDLQQAIAEAQLSRSQRKMDSNTAPEAIKVITKPNVSFKKEKKPVKIEGVIEVMVTFSRPLTSVQSLIQFFKSNGYKAL